MSRLTCESCVHYEKELEEHPCDSCYGFGNYVAAESFVKVIKDPRKAATKQQVGGDHYKGKAIQPVEYIHANKLDFFEGNAIKYITRWRDKGGKADLEKAKHYIDLLIEMEGLE